MTARRDLWLVSRSRSRLLLKDVRQHRCRSEACVVCRLLTRQPLPPDALVEETRGLQIGRVVDGLSPEAQDIVAGFVAFLSGLEGPT